MSADLRLDEFLRIQKDVELPNGEIVTVRVLSDLELNARRDYALSESVRVTEALKNPESELYRTKIAPLVDAGKDSLIDVLADAWRMELARQALDVYRVDFFPYPDNASDQEMIDARMKQAEHEKEIQTQRAEYIIKGEASYREKMSAMPFEAIVKETQSRAVQVYSASVASDCEIYYTVWCATEVGGHKKWHSPEEVKQLPSKVIDFLNKAYREVDSVDPWSLTKSEFTGESVGVGEVSPNGKRKGKRSASA